MGKSNGCYNMKKRELNGVSLFSSAGIGETFFKECGINIKVANEIIPKRADLYKKLHLYTEVVCGDIKDDEVFNKILLNAGKDVDFLLASPPCQGMSVAGKNRCQVSMANDERNYLFTYVVKAINQLKPKYVLIENVPSLLKLVINYKNQTMSAMQILENEFGDIYNIDGAVLDSADYGVPQTRNRAIIKMNLKEYVWNWPKKDQKKVTVKDAIGYLPSLEAGERSKIKWHFARKHDERHVLWMKHTPTGKSAFSNPIYYPQKPDGTRIKGYESSYRRIKWDEPAPTITIRNDAISSQRNVHPGNKLQDGTYSDARVLTPLELMILTSLPVDWPVPDDTPEILIRQCIGESIPPLLIKRIVEEIE